jgi:hypothetical protein
MFSSQFGQVVEPSRSDRLDYGCVDEGVKREDYLLDIAYPQA